MVMSKKPRDIVNHFEFPLLDVVMIVSLILSWSLQATCYSVIVIYIVCTEDIYLVQGVGLSSQEEKVVSKGKRDDVKL